MSDYFERVAKRIMQWLSESSQPSAGYMIDSELRPLESRETLTLTLDAAVRYYENQGQTWQRLAFIKARGVAGDISLASEFLSQLEPWVYRRYLSRSDITENCCPQASIGETCTGCQARRGRFSVSTGRHKRYQVSYTVFAVAQRWRTARSAHWQYARSHRRLEHAGCLTVQERSVLDDNYRFFQRIEHRLQ